METIENYEEFKNDLGRKFNNSSRICFDYMLWMAQEIDQDKSKFNSLYSQYIMVMRGLKACPFRCKCKRVHSVAHTGLHFHWQQELLVSKMSQCKE